MSKKVIPSYPGSSAGKFFVSSENITSWKTRLWILILPKSFIEKP